MGDTRKKASAWLLHSTSTSIIASIVLSIWPLHKGPCPFWNIPFHLLILEYYSLWETIFFIDLQYKYICKKVSWFCSTRFWGHEGERQWQRWDSRFIGSMSCQRTLCGLAPWSRWVDALAGLQHETTARCWASVGNAGPTSSRRLLFARFLQQDSAREPVRICTWRPPGLSGSVWERVADSGIAIKPDHYQITESVITAFSTCYVLQSLKAVTVHLKVSFVIVFALHHCICRNALLVTWWGNSHTCK